MTYRFTAHDLSMVHHISDRIGVMYIGSMVEPGTSEKVFENPLHPYTKALISAISVPAVPVERTVAGKSGPSSGKSNLVTLPGVISFNPYSAMKGLFLGGTKANTNTPAHSGRGDSEGAIFCFA